MVSPAFYFWLSRPPVQLKNTEIMQKISGQLSNAAHVSSLVFQLASDITRFQSIPSGWHTSLEFHL